MSARSLPQTALIKIEVNVPTRDSLTLELEVSSDGEIVSSKLTAVGCSEMLKLVSEWRAILKGRLDALPLPKGSAHAAILLREAILKAQGRWHFPYPDDELCHCRAVPTAKVDAAIVGGCHTIDAVKRATSASTSCGTCRPDVERVIAYRLKD